MGQLGSNLIASVDTPCLRRMKNAAVIRHHCGCERRNDMVDMRLVLQQKQSSLWGMQQGFWGYLWTVPPAMLKMPRPFAPGVLLLTICSCRLLTLPHFASLEKAGLSETPIPADILKPQPCTLSLVGTCSRMENAFSNQQGKRLQQHNPMT